MYLSANNPEPVYLKGFIPAEAGPVVVKQKMDGKLESVTTLPVVIENGKRGMVYTGYVIYSQNGFYRPSPKPELTQFKVPGKKVFVLLEQTDNGLAIRESSLESI